VAKQIIQRVIEAEPQALKKPAPDILLWEFSDFRMTFRVNYFVDTAKCNRFEVNSGILDKVLALLREAGIEIPSPKEDVNLRVIKDKVEKPSVIMPLPRS
jgi:small-conductance mechanosensitive channel